jgi:LysR family transcriptional regulator for bpeEF and oprC
MNKLLSMLAFVRVAETGSFTAVAVQLGVSVSAVAKAVIKAGRLRPLLERYAVAGHPLNIVYPPLRHMPTKLRVMIDFLSALGE